MRSTCPSTRSTSTWPTWRADTRILLICQSGARASRCQQTLSSAGLDGTLVLDGGIGAWLAVGHPVVRGRARWALDRQVRLAAGLLVASAVAVSIWWPPTRYLAGLIGVGLAAAAATNTCALGMLLSRLPYNQRVSGTTSTPNAPMTQRTGSGRHMSLLTAIVLGLLIGLSLGALGGGGSILTVPALVYVLGEPARAATTESLVIVGITALVAAIGHARAGRVKWGAGLTFGAVGIAASYAGTAANRSINPDLLLLAFAGLIVAAATAMTIRQRRCSDCAEGSTTATTPTAEQSGGLAVLTAAPAHTRTTTTAVAKVIAAGLTVGFLTGFFGVGGGFVIVPALVMVLGYPMPTAVGTSLLVIAVNSAAALAARAGDATFHWSVIIPFTVAAIASSLAGKRMADRVRPATLTRAFVALLLAVAAYVAIRSGAALLT